MIYLSPQGSVLTQKRANELAKLDYYDEKAVESPLIGKVIDTDTSAVQAILADQSAIWQANDLDSKLKELEKVYNENNAEMIVDRIKAVLN